MTTATAERRDTSSTVVCRKPGIRFLSQEMRRYPATTEARTGVYRAIEAASMFAAREMAGLIGPEGAGKYNMLIDLGDETSLMEPLMITSEFRELIGNGEVPDGDFSASVCCKPEGDYLSMVYRTRT